MEKLVADLHEQVKGHVDRIAELERENERLAEIERIFNEGWLPAIPGEGASLKLRSLHELRDLIPPVSPPERVSEEDKDDG